MIYLKILTKKMAMLKYQKMKELLAAVRLAITRILVKMMMMRMMMKKVTVKTCYRLKKQTLS